MKNKTICIIGAMDSEIARLKSVLQNIQEVKQGLLTFYKGVMHGFNIVLVKSGVGKVCAAVCTQIAADKFSPDFIINTGIAGGLADGMQTGDVVIAEKLVQHDFDASAIGYAKGYVCNNINPDKPTFFYADKKLIEILKRTLDEKLPNIKYHCTAAASGDMFIGSSAKKKELVEMFGAGACDMEAAAIAHAAVLNEIPFIIIRSLSDLADEQAGEGHKFSEEKSADTAAKTIETFIEQLQNMSAETVSADIA